jgi:hypothetical protein
MKMGFNNLSLEEITARKQAKLSAKHALFNATFDSICDLTEDEYKRKYDATNDWEEQNVLILTHAYINLGTSLDAYLQQDVFTVDDINTTYEKFKHIYNEITSAEHLLGVRYKMNYDDEEKSKIQAMYDKIIDSECYSSKFVDLVECLSSLTHVDPSIFSGAYKSKYNKCFAKLFDDGKFNREMVSAMYRLYHLCDLSLTPPRMPADEVKEIYHKILNEQTGGQDPFWFEFNKYDVVTNLLYTVTRIDPELTEEQKQYNAKLWKEYRARIEPHYANTLPKSY